MSSFSFDAAVGEAAAAAARVAAAAAAGEAACAHCGVRSRQLRECSACRHVSYCSKECQRGAWKKHKLLCKRLAASRGGGTVGKQATPAARGKQAGGAAAAAGGDGAAGANDPGSAGADEAARLGGIDQTFRDVTVATPSAAHVRGACACCAILLKGDAGGATPAAGKHVLGGFWVEWSASVQPPALQLMNDIFDAESASGLDVKQYFVESETTAGAVNALVCRGCAERLTEDADGWAKKCEHWLKARGIGMVVPELAGTTFNWLEQRLIAAAALLQEPDLSEGPASVAARKTAHATGATPDILPFSHDKLEPMAFPAQLTEGKHGWCEGQLAEEEAVLGELRHYTYMRLYSADSRWRADQDYVVFSLHRLAAYGDAIAAEALAKLPAPAKGGEARSGELSLLDYSV